MFVALSVVLLLSLQLSQVVCTSHDVCTNIATLMCSSYATEACPFVLHSIACIISVPLPHAHMHPEELMLFTYTSSHVYIHPHPIPPPLPLTHTHSHSYFAELQQHYRGWKVHKRNKAEMTVSIIWGGGCGQWVPGERGT